MSELNEVPTEELLSFQDYPTTHTTGSSQYTGAQLNIGIPQQYENTYRFDEKGDIGKPFQEKDEESANLKSFWSIEYYQQFFNVDTADVLDRILGSVYPRRDSTFKNLVKVRPDLYGPFWIAVTLVFTIAISGNVVNYLQHVNATYHWKYDFHLVSYAATAIFIYVTVIPILLWCLLKWTRIIDLDNIEDVCPPKTLELICIYGYSLFIYIPTSVLWTIQVEWLQWLLVGIAALLSGSVLLFTLNPALKMSKFKLILRISIAFCHLTLAAGFMLYFFHVPTITVQPVTNTTIANTNNTSKN